jgi:hypothetical protein
MHYESSVRAALGAALAVALAGCSLISSDVTNFDLTLPDKKFSIDSQGWQVDATAARSYTMQSCTSSPTICSSAVDQACSAGCSGACGAAGTCELSLELSLAQPVNLVMERPELKSINDEPVIKVAIDSVTYEVPYNTLNVATPELTLYVAPMSVTAIASGDPQIKPIGTIAPVPAGQTITVPQPIAFTATGKAQLINIMSTFKTPFNVLMGAAITVTAGQAVPMGRLDAVVHIKGHAGL